MDGRSQAWPGGHILGDRPGIKQPVLFVAPLKPTFIHVQFNVGKKITIRSHQDPTCVGANCSFTTYNLKTMDVWPHNQLDILTSECEPLQFLLWNKCNASLPPTLMTATISTSSSSPCPACAFSNLACSCGARYSVGYIGQWFMIFSHDQILVPYYIFLFISQMAPPNDRVLQAIELDQHLSQVTCWLNGQAPIPSPKFLPNVFYSGSSWLKNWSQKVLR